MTIEEKQQRLNEIAGKIAATKGGPMESFGSNPVPGEGNPDAKILWVGEAPGATENQLGRPFVGVSGKLLRRTMVENGFAEKDVFITNIVKFRPPENRDPTPEEIGFFKPFLDEQLEVIDPKFIVTLGRYSIYKFLGIGSSITKIHGQPRTINWTGKSRIIFPMFHPAAALRDPKVMQAFKDDLKKLKDLVENQPKPEKPKDEQLKLV